MTKIDYSASIDYSRAAKALLIETVESLGLNYSIDYDEPGEYEMTLEAQKGLSFGLWLCLQNNDELWLGVEDNSDYVSFVMLPFDHVKEKFISALRGLILGECRILRVKLFSNAFFSFFVNSAKLQKPNGDGWITVASQGSIFGWLFIKWRYQVTTNRDAHNLLAT